MARAVVVVLAAAAALAAAPAAATLRTVGAQVDCVDAQAWPGFAAAAGIPGAKGIYDEATGRISLPDGSCDLLDSLARGYAPHAQFRAYELAEAVFVLGHELRHADGVEDEHAADCDAARGFVPLAQRLGATRSYALELLTYLPLRVCG